MLRKALNELTLAVKINGLSPLLVKDGRESKEKGDKERPAMIFQSRLTREDLDRANWNPPNFSCSQFFVPGSSIRGAWRSHLERILRSFDEQPKVCDPFAGIGPEDQEKERKAAEEARGDASCSIRLANKEGTAPPHAYRDSCPICQLFGNTAQGSRIAFAEGKITGGKPTLIDNNAISRQTGAAISPFKSLVLLDAEIETEVQLRNFELWQVGLLAHLFDDLKNGLVRLGSGKSKGWGRVKAQVTAIKLTYFGLDNSFAENRLLGVGEMLPAEMASRYGMARCEEPPELPGYSADTASSLWRHSATISDAAAFWNSCRSCFNERTWNAVRPLAARRERES